MAEPDRKTRAKGRRPRTGVVTSTRGDKTIHVVVENVVRDARYGKYMRRHTKLAAHDAKNTASVGDLVEIVPCRRMSKTKSWRLTRIVRPGSPEEVEIQRLDQ